MKFAVHTWLAGLLGLAAAFSAQASDDDNELPANIVAQLPKGYEVMTSASGQLNGDALRDWLVVVHNPDEKAIAQEQEKSPARPVLLFVQLPDKRFRLAARNDRVVMGVNEGGQCRKPVRFSKYAER